MLVWGGIKSPHAGPSALPAPGGGRRGRAGGGGAPVGGGIVGRGEVGEVDDGVTSFFVRNKL